ncbi:Preprotein translocase subunit YajC (TC 3.A.5.1.1) [Alloactinosynnema sp. L-07]|uniref:preprotein translocase subunit YajC n=1 Tax=Alloactinosynnema sp. L-07 TaxID=1653480 RepID=UPI00065EFA1C|nr:preprotein translocase subunit YajC [Alloactinosynnema sp. L-07]CRK58117.1 Preprotein translocase subunit YajC (TC 3.A.5.1.1) [Alloactinosynnema sp. L-07]
MNQALLPLLLVAVLAIPLILGSRRQKKAMAQQQELQDSLAVGDRVMTTSGMYGTVSDTSDSATISLEIAPGVETEWLRQAIREKVGPDEHEDDDDEATDTADTDSTAQVAPPLDHGK